MSQFINAAVFSGAATLVANVFYKFKISELIASILNQTVGATPEIMNPIHTLALNAIYSASTSEIFLYLGQGIPPTASFFGINVIWTDAIVSGVFAAIIAYFMPREMEPELRQTIITFAANFISVLLLSL